jgi:DNA-binding MarR family transcriptional regulator
MSQNLDHQLCFLLYANSRSIIKLYKPLLDPHDLTYTQYITLLALWDKDDETLKELGVRLYLDSGTLTPVIKKLEQADLVTKQRSKEDERRVIITLTPKGKQMKIALKHIPTTLAKKLDVPKDEGVLIFKHLNKLLKIMNK